MSGHTENSTLGFGNWRVDLRDRELRADGTPVPLGSRAFDILAVLAQSAGELVSKNELLRRVWAGAAVEENVLQVHISAIRKALGPDRGLIATASGQGYRLLGDWTAAADDAETNRPAVTQTISRPSLGNLPVATSELIGREAAAARVANLVSAHRVVTLVGPGGIGKTRIALEVARALVPHFADGVWLVELAPIADPGLVATVVAMSLGLDLGVSDVSPASLARAIATRRVLIVIDNCEHVIDEVARVVETIVRVSPTPHLLATSRETLRVDGEHSYRVSALDVPPEHEAVPSRAAEHGAVRLFTARMQAALGGVERWREDQDGIVSICRRLDGIPLAIELAAACAATLGVAETARHINDRFRLLASGRRTAPPRHRTLRATLDWSYDLLSVTERLVFRQVATFAGGFTMDAAHGVLVAPSLDDGAISEGVIGLVTKSLLAANTSETATRYVMLETVRAYALDVLVSDAGDASIAQRHASYFRDLFEHAQVAWRDQDHGDWLRTYRAELGNVRAALDWAFAPAGDASIGVMLTNSSIPLLFDLSLVGECRGRAARALQAIEAGTPVEPEREMQLRAVVQAARVYVDGPSPASLAGWRTVLDMSIELDDAEYQARALWGLWNDNTYGGAPAVALAFAERFEALGVAKSDVAKQIFGRRLIGISRHYLGEQAVAREHLDYVLSHYNRALHRWQTIGSRLDQAPVTRATLARVLWLQGEPEQAVRQAERAARDAEMEDHVQSMLYILVEATIPLSLLSGDVETTEGLVETLLELAARSGFAIWESYGRCFVAMLHVVRDGGGAGLKQLRDAIRALQDIGFCAHLTMFLGALADGERRAGVTDDALATIDVALDWCDAHGERWCMAELLRIKAEIVVGDASRAEELLRDSLDWARQQGALSWELRSAVSLLRLRWRHGDDAVGAETLLASVYARFREGFSTADMKDARALLGGG